MRWLRWTTILHVYNIFYNLLSHHIKQMMVIDLTIDTFQKKEDRFDN